MTIITTLQQSIRQEKQMRENFARTDLTQQIVRGQGQQALESLIYFAPLESTLKVLESLESVVDRLAGDETAQHHLLDFLARLHLALNSLMPCWRAYFAGGFNPTRPAPISCPGADVAARQARALAIRLARAAPVVEQRLLAQWKAETAARFKAEQSAEPAAQAERLVGDSVGTCLENLSAALAHSHLRRIAEMRFAGLLPTELSNDFAAFLPYALHLGASFATTNPPLVNLAWDAEPERWNATADRLIAEHPHEDAAGLVRWFTLEVVLEQMRALRPIFLLSEGRMGYVCLQVAPTQHANAQAMVSDASFFYQELKRRLNGGVPNVVFKLPGTWAGLEACRTLTRQGIGVTITVCFGLFQHLPFVQAIQEGQALCSTVVEMNGRLAFPVRDELLGKLDALAAQGIGEAQARWAAAWAGVAVVKRLHRILTEKGVDQSRVRPLVASLRLYEGEVYRTLPSSIPDITEVLGTRIISVFPNIRRPFDAQEMVALNPQQVERPVPEEALRILCHSEIFKQAYYVADHQWLPEEDGRFRPELELRLEDEAQVARWVPVQATLAEFIKAYQSTGERLQARRLLATPPD